MVPNVSNYNRKRLENYIFMNTICGLSIFISIIENNEFCTNKSK